ncbi:hypothetical protein [Polaromonas sp. CG9_12]|nr:hypothetical protein [Polaromonas sp. CG9_12]
MRMYFFHEITFSSIKNPKNHAVKLIFQPCFLAICATR